MVNKNKSKKILLISIFVSIILVLGFLAVSQTVIGVSNELNYITDWSNQDLTSGSYQSEAELVLPKDTTVFSFTPDYDFKTYYRSSSPVTVTVKYQVYNSVTSALEEIYSNSISLKNYDRESVKFKMDGETVYNSGIPEHIQAVRTGSSSYVRYYGCLQGMSVDEAKQLNPWAEGTSSYSYRCLYPGDSINEHDYSDDGDENWDIEEFPKLITLDSNYISEDKAKFRISVSISGSGIDSVNNGDFGIDLWELKTPVIDTYGGVSCDYQAKYTYQTVDTDYFTEKECLYQNNLIECYVNSHCTEQPELIGECQENSCEYRKETIIDKIFPDKEKPVEDSATAEKTSKLVFVIPLVILTLIILIIRNILKKRKK